MAIDGYRVELGKAAKGARLEEMVTKESVTELLEKARRDPEFEKAKGEYEFRLRNCKGTAVLELRRPTTGFVAKLFGRGRRSAERLAAYEALGRQLPLPAAASRDMRKADARAAATQAIGLEALQRKAGDGSLFREVAPTENAVRAQLAAVEAFGLQDKTEAVEGVGFKVPQQTMTLLARAEVAVDPDGTLRIRTPAKGGNGPGNVKKIIEHAAQQLGQDPGDPETRRLARNLLTSIRSGVDQTIGVLVEKHLERNFGVQAFGTPKSMEIALRFDDYKLDASISQTVALPQLAAVGISDNAYSARLDFSWGLADDEGLSGRKFRAADAWDIKFACGPAGADL